jgi:hypothetical protein
MAEYLRCSLKHNTQIRSPCIAKKKTLKDFIADIDSIMNIGICQDGLYPESGQYHSSCVEEEEEEKEEEEEDEAKNKLIMITTHLVSAWQRCQPGLGEGVLQTRSFPWV